jgi:hypothetical protein
MPEGMRPIWDGAAGDVSPAQTSADLRWTYVQATYAVFPVGVSVCSTCSGVQCVLSPDPWFQPLADHPIGHMPKA